MNAASPRCPGASPSEVVTLLRHKPLSPVEVMMAMRLHGQTRPLFTTAADLADALRSLAKRGLAEVEDGVGMAQGLTFALPTAALNALRFEDGGR